MALAAAELMALGGQAPFQLGDDAVHRGQILDRAARERPIELVQGPLGRQRRRALDEAALELAAQVGFEAAQLLAGKAGAAGVVLGQIGLRLGPEAERAAVTT